MLTSKRLSFKLKARHPRPVIPFCVNATVQQAGDGTSCPGSLRTRVRGDTNRSPHLEDRPLRTCCTRRKRMPEIKRGFSFPAGRFFNSLLILARSRSPPTTNGSCLPENGALIKGKQEALMVAGSCVCVFCSPAHPDMMMWNTHTRVTAQLRPSEQPHGLFCWLWQVSTHRFEKNFRIQP